MKKCPLLVNRAFFQISLCSKNPIWGIFSLKMGHFFVSRGWQPWKGASEGGKKKLRRLRRPLREAGKGKKRTCTCFLGVINAVEGNMGSKKAFEKRGLGWCRQSKTAAAGGARER